MNRQQIDLLITEGQKQIIVNGSILFQVEEKEGIPEIHISDILHALVTGKLKSQSNATLPPGSYSMAITIALSSTDGLTKQAQPPPLPKKEICEEEIVEEDIELVEDEPGENHETQDHTREPSPTSQEESP